MEDKNIKVLNLKKERKSLFKVKRLRNCNNQMQRVHHRSTKQKANEGEFLGSPAVQTLSFLCQGCGVQTLVGN